MKRSTLINLWRALPWRRKPLTVVEATLSGGNDGGLARQFDGLLRCQALLADIRQHTAGLVEVSRQADTPEVQEAARRIGSAVVSAIAQTEDAKRQVRRRLGRRFRTLADDMASAGPPPSPD